MSEILSLHEYELKPGVPGQALEAAVQTANARRLFDLPGLQGFLLLRGVKGAHRGRYAILWRYQSRQAWEALWGSLEQPKARQDYPPSWRIWEDEFLAPLLAQHPDSIRYTAYEVVLKN